MISLFWLASDRTFGAISMIDNNDIINVIFVFHWKNDIQNDNHCFGVKIMINHCFDHCFGPKIMISLFWGQNNDRSLFWPQKNDRKYNHCFGAKKKIDLCFYCKIMTLLVYWEVAFVVAKLDASRPRMRGRGNDSWHSWPPPHSKPGKKSVSLHVQ